MQTAASASATAATGSSASGSGSGSATGAAPLSTGAAARFGIEGAALLALAGAAAVNAFSPEPQPDVSATNPMSKQAQKPFSCVLCAQRKVKCDKRTGGCNNCTKARVPCIYKAPPPPRRRRKGVRHVDTTTKLRVYENALRNAGIDPESLLKQTPLLEDDHISHARPNVQNVGQTTLDQSEEPAATEIGVLLTEHGKSRYLENGIWTSLRSEFRDLKEILDETSDDESFNDNIDSLPDAFSPDGSRLMFGSPTSSTGLRPLHPRPVESFRLWQTYLENINPLIKLFHAPTVQQMLSQANGNLDELPRREEALLFAIYCIAVESLSDAECIAILGDSKGGSRQRFRTGAQHALINASFLKTSDLMVLQALTLFVLSLQDIDARIVWMLSGVCQRIGQRIGLHRDGDMLKLPPFEAEIRRRLWWQIIMLEGFSQKLAGTGTGSNASVLMGDVKLPANLNDADLFPGMKELPKESDRATEMMFFLIRCHVGNFLKRFETPQVEFDGVWGKLTTRAVDVNIKEKAIRELKDLFEQKFLRHCDSSIVWHLMCSHLAKAIIFMMRFMAYGADYQGKTETQEEKDTLFSLSLQVCSSQILVYTMKEMQGFVWHVNMHFQWKALVYVLSELRYRTSGQQVEEAWRDIQLTYEFHPTFDEELSKRALPIAVSNLTLKAWEAYIAANGVPESGEPYFIQLIRNRRTRREGSSTSSGQTDTLPSEITTLYPPYPQQQPVPNGDITDDADHLAAFPWNPADLNVSLGLPPAMPDFDHTTQMDWSAWNNLVVDFQTNDADDHLPDISTFNFDIDSFTLTAQIIGRFHAASPRPQINQKLSATQITKPSPCSLQISMATASQRQALALFESLLASGAYSDLTITCGGRVYKVHRVVVCSRAGFFARAIKFGGQEAQAGTIDLPEDDPETVELLLHFLYGGEYHPGSEQDGAALPTRAVCTPRGYAYTYAFPHVCSDYEWGECMYICPHHRCGDGMTFFGSNHFTCSICNTPPLPALNGTADQLLTHAKMYEMGDKYDVEGLKDLAREKFDRACKHFWKTPSFAVAAHHAFSTTVDDDKGLRDIVSTTISEHIELVNDPGVSVLMTQFNGLALGVLQAKIKEYGWDKND
ncbi:hypothetical protein OPT61_g9463 [Boeremia exigua]|uniref:Uncharacterized protein n=1 Tax=Boeremia exigua TaxID=749465 RepID=A0ACC2HTY5_9PLEO|nr:hypothetical protein OPT61_g9463 [Boeremia exigua]